MKNRRPAYGLLIFLFACMSVAPANADRYTSTTAPDDVTRIYATINITYSGPHNSSFREGEWFNMSASVLCNVTYCGTIVVYPLYCKSAGCDKYTNLGKDSYGGVYTKNESAHSCLGVDSGGRCSYAWQVKAMKTGHYSLLFVATAEHAAPVYSGFMDIFVRGCGDGICNQSENETYENCPGDCCKSNCTADYDIICHERCAGYNNCSFVSGCDNRASTYSECLSPTAYIRCCSVDVTHCDSGTYCSGAACHNCSYKCDGECQSAACFGPDPDCGRDGNANMPCCGNFRLDPIEECEWGVSGTECDGRCLPNCTCAPDVTTTRRAATTIVITTTQTTNNPWIRNPNVSDTTTPQSTTLPVINETATDTLSPDMDPMPLLLIPASLLLLAAAVYLLRHFNVYGARKQYELLKNREDTLKKLIKITSDNYTAQRINSEEASKKIYGYEKELAGVRAKMEKTLAKIKK
jgi:hypothetical protein